MLISVVRPLLCHAFHCCFLPPHSSPLFRTYRIRSSKSTSPPNDVSRPSPPAGERSKLTSSPPLVGSGPRPLNAKAGRWMGPQQLHTKYEVYAAPANGWCSGPRPTPSPATSMQLDEKRRLCDDSKPHPLQLLTQRQE